MKRHLAAVLSFHSLTKLTTVRRSRIHGSLPQDPVTKDVNNAW